MVDYDSIRIGMHGYKELEAKEQVRKDVQRFPRKGGFHRKVCSDHCFVIDDAVRRPKDLGG